MEDTKTSWDDLIKKLRHIGNSHAGDEHLPLIRNLFKDKLVLYEDSPGPNVILAHYTKWKNILNMFGERDAQSNELISPILRMYNYEQSNDPDEGQIKPPEWRKVEENAWDWLNDCLRNNDRWTREIEHGGSTYGCSFSSGQEGVEDDLTYWRLYGDDGQGCSLKVLSTHNIGVYEVRYRSRDCSDRTECQKKEDKEIAKRLKDLYEAGEKAVNSAPDRHRDEVGEIVAYGFLRALYGYYSLIKHIAYAGEKEWRMIEVMPTPDVVKYDVASDNSVKRYVEGPFLCKLLGTGSAVTIGPTVPNLGAARAYLENLIKAKHKIQYADVNVWGLYTVLPARGGEGSKQVPQSHLE